MSAKQQVSRIARPTVTVLCGSYAPPDLATIEASADVRHTDDLGLVDTLPGTDALFLWDSGSTVLEAAIGSADRLRWIHTAGVGVDNLIFDEIRDSDVTLTNSSGVFDGAIAEYVLGSILQFAKDFRGTMHAQVVRQWNHRETERIAGQAVAVVGTGPIGRAIARLVKAVGMTVVGFGRTRRTHDPDFGQVHPTLLPHIATADYVVAAAPLTPDTAGMFDASVFAAMKPSARFINIGRGQLVVTGDLLDALNRNSIAGAMLDVFEDEPLPGESDLWTTPNVIVSPHMSATTAGWLDAVTSLFIDNFHRWSRGAPLRNVVDKKLGYVPSSR